MKCGEQCNIKKKADKPCSPEVFTLLPVACSGENLNMLGHLEMLLHLREGRF